MWRDRESTDYSLHWVVCRFAGLNSASRRNRFVAAPVLFALTNKKVTFMLNEVFSSARLRALPLFVAILVAAVFECDSALAQSYTYDFTGNVEYGTGKYSGVTGPVTGTFTIDFNNYNPSQSLASGYIGDPSANWQVQNYGGSLDGITAPSVYVFTNSVQAAGVSYDTAAPSLVFTNSSVTGEYFGVGNTGYMLFEQSNVNGSAYYSSQITINQPISWTSNGGPVLLNGGVGYADYGYVFTPNSTLTGDDTLQFSLTSITLQPTPPANLILNGNFHLPGKGCVPAATTLPDWSVVSGNIDIEDATCTDGMAGKAETYYLDLTGSNAETGQDDVGIISQTITTVVQQQYKLTFDFGGNPQWQEFSTQPNDSEYKAMAVFVNGAIAGVYGVHTAGVSVTNPQWTARTILFTAASPSTTITFQSLNGSTSNPSDFGPLLDSVRVVAVVATAAERK
jgi:hypothetical protein